ncbi:FtsB family cell division protein [Ornithobacterium rhinotracheale]|uniref:FtsB family cell division protein n=1 Tax=Ornithobacterium rhinotracheale TaxID=28251 RepID=UPI003FA42FC8
MEKDNSSPNKNIGILDFLSKYKYVIVTVAFSVWMLFFDQNSFLMHKELSSEISKLNEDVEYYQKELDAQNEELKQLEHNKNSYEKIAREKYFMKKSNEDIFIIELKDSIQPEEN